MYHFRRMMISTATICLLLLHFTHTSEAVEVLIFNVYPPFILCLMVHILLAGDSLTSLSLERETTNYVQEHYLSIAKWHCKKWTQVCCCRIANSFPSFSWGATMYITLLLALLTPESDADADANISLLHIE